MLDNIYRTLILKKDENHFFYHNDDNTYTLLENETNFIFSLTYDLETRYFTTYQDAWLYLREKIKLEAQRVVIKKEE